MNKQPEYLSLILLDLTGLVLIALQFKVAGWLLFIAGLLSLNLCNKQFRRYMFLLYICLGILGITEINTDISVRHMLQMGTFLILAIAIPYYISKNVYKDHLVRFQFHHGRNWYTSEILYVFASGIVAFLVLPFYLRDTGSYHYWTVEPGTWSLTRLFIGTNALGIWDELFFVSTVLGILRRFFSFPVANTAQAVLFTSFLYELGFRGWAPFMIFGFALLQGYIFKKTESLFYIITIHLTIDFFLYLALINAYYPTWIPIFIT